MNIDGSDVVRITDNEERDDFPRGIPMAIGSYMSVKGTVRRTSSC